MGEFYDIIIPENPEEPKTFKCKLCDFTTTSQGEMLGHHNPKKPDRCPNRDWTKKEEKTISSTAVQKPSKIDSSLSDREIVAQHGWEGLQFLGRRIVEKYIQNAPGLGEKTSEWILNLWDADENIRRDPNSLHRALLDAGAKPNIAYRIGSAINSLYREYYPLVETNQQLATFGDFGHGRVPGFLLNQNNWQGFRQGFNPYSGGSGATHPPGYVSRDELQRMLDERDRRHQQELEKRETEHKMESIEKKVEDIRNDLPRIVRESMPASQDIEEIEMPVDENGKPTTPDKAVSVVTRRRPSGSSTTDPLEIIDKLAKLGVFGSKSNITADEVRKIVSESKESPAVAKLEEQLKEMNKRYDDLKDKMSEDQKKRMAEQIQGLENKIDGLKSSLASSGVNSPEGVLATGLQELGKRKPMGEVRDIVRDLFTPGAISEKPAAEKASATARNPIIENLRHNGLVTTVRERMGVRQ